MKYLLILLIALPLSTAAQYSKLNRDSWRVGKTKNMYGSDITRVEGKNSYQWNFNFQEATNVGFETRAYAIAEMRNRAELEMWPQSKIDERLAYYTSSDFVGRVHLYIRRSTIHGVDPSLFTCVMQDTTGKDLTRFDFRESIGDYGYNSWYNSDQIVISGSLPSEFLIHIIDRVEKERYTFRVSVPD